MCGLVLLGSRAVWQLLSQIHQLPKRQDAHWPSDRGSWQFGAVADQVDNTRRGPLLDTRPRTPILLSCSLILCCGEPPALPFWQLQWRSASLWLFIDLWHTLDLIRIFCNFDECQVFSGCHCLFAIIEIGDRQIEWQFGCSFCLFGYDGCLTEFDNRHCHVKFWSSARPRLLLHAVIIGVLSVTLYKLG